MKITHVEAIPVRVPRPQPFQSSLGTHQASENAVILIHTDAGLTGLGEASSIWDRRGRGESEAINGLLADVLRGLDPRRIREIADRMNQVLHRSFPAKAGIEMALYDLVGKACGVPVYQLLGGLVRDRVLLSHSLSMGDPDSHRRPSPEPSSPRVQNPQGQDRAGHSRRPSRARSRAQRNR